MFQSPLPPTPPPVPSQSNGQTTPLQLPPDVKKTTDFLNQFRSNDLGMSPINPLVKTTKSEPEIYTSSPKVVNILTDNAQDVSPMFGSKASQKISQRNSPGLTGRAIDTTRTQKGFVATGLLLDQMVSQYSVS